MTTDFSDITDLFQQFKPLDENIFQQAEAHQAQLTKPLHSLGRLEQLACWYESVRGTHPAPLNHPRIAVFAANHGVAANHQISAFPTDVTAAMLKNFQNGGAAINQIAGMLNADFYAYNLNLQQPTEDFTVQAAMKEQACAHAISYGMMAVEDKVDVIIPGEMGIGNSTAAAAIYHALYGGAAQDWVGRGTGIDDNIYQQKTDLVAKAVALHADNFKGVNAPLEILRHVGGFEICAILGCIIAARIAKVAVILDGYIACAAAAILHEIDADYIAHCVAGHVSDEQAHINVLEKLNKPPILDLQMRLGEASGGATALAILKIALACHHGMQSFDDANVSQKI
ncbi:MAG: nicotinate-nucleotide--dimethylbenzimidazole phosphoribosyltransferase [Alphaproteobacteria bacterium]|nr:nicotinate-nucleotide--dimethylbenzimidazole phosphoribosyltransferase [Alphaproteobacteria bacterium]